MVRDGEPDLSARQLTILLTVYLEPPFYCDYGANIELGERVFFNFNCTLLDVMPITIGNAVLIGPSVQIYTAMHPTDWQERASGKEFAKPVTIGDNVTIGSGSVVVKSIPPNSVAVGNPARVIHQNTELKHIAPTAL